MRSLNITALAFLVVLIAPAWAGADEMGGEPVVVPKARPAAPAATAPAAKEDRFAGFGKSFRFEGFAMPIGMPYLFEEPFTVTGIHAEFIRHEFPEHSTDLPGGGQFIKGGYANLFAVQARLAITDRLSFIATRDGYIWFREGSGSAYGNDHNGWMDLAGGFKYALYIDRYNDGIISVGFRYRSHTGSRDVFQGHGAGAAQPFISAGKGFGPIKLIGNFGAEIPFDNDDNSTFLHWGVQANTRIAEILYPLVSVTGIKYVGNGDRLPINWEGLDVANIGSANVTGNDVVWGGLGFRVAPIEHVTVGFLWETALTSRKDVFDDRYTASLSLEF